MVDGEDIQVRKWMGNDLNLNSAHLYNFIAKFVRDEKYRNEYISGKRQ